MYSTSAKTVMQYFLPGIRRELDTVMKGFRNSNGGWNRFTIDSNWTRLNQVNFELQLALHEKLIGKLLSVL